MDRSRHRSPDDFSGVDAPELILLDVAAVVADHHEAPATVATADICNNSSFDDGYRACPRAVIVEQRCLWRRLSLLQLPREHERGATSGKHGVQNPTRGAFCISHLAPGLVLVQDLDRQAGPVEHPRGWVVGARPATQIDTVRLEAHEARNSQSAGASPLRWLRIDMSNQKHRRG